MIKLTKKEIVLSASVSCFDLFCIKPQMRMVEAAGIELLHFDVVDGRFNDCIILGTPTLKAIRPHTQLPIEVHLGVFEPEKYISQFAEAGADYIAVHYEVMKNPQGIFDLICECGARPVLALRAETEATEDMLPLIAQVDWVLKLTVNPGYSGQAIQPDSFQKIKNLRAMIAKTGLLTSIQADGNINLNTIPAIVKAGADMLTGGTSGLFIAGKPIRQTAAALLQSAHAAKHEK